MDKYDILGSVLGNYLLKNSPNLPRGDEGLNSIIDIIEGLLVWVGAKPKNYSNFAIIGAGAFAKVFWCKNDRKKVLKVTTDEEDALSCAILAKKPDKSLLKVYKVAKIPQTDLYAILVEKLTPLSSAQTKTWEEAVRAIKKLGVSIVHLGLQEYTIDDIRLGIELAEKGNPKIAKAAKKVLPTLQLWSDKLFEDRGIMWRDFHEGNIHMRGRTPIILDFGQSDVRGAPSIPVLPVNFKNE